MRILLAADAARLRAAAYTYDDVGATEHGRTPPGYARLSVRLPVQAPLDAAVDRLLTWRMHEGAGLRVRASSERVVPGAVVELGVGIGPLRLPAACRVLEVTEAGFTYGTLPGHPESGEERFHVVRREGRTWLEVTAFSRPGRWFTRAAGPLGGLAQQAMTRRYARALGD